MTASTLPAKPAWILPQKISFRFFFIYFILYSSPWDNLAIIPGIGWLIEWYNKGMEWAVVTANEHFFQVFGVRQVKQVFNGSGDTSYSWAAFCLLLSLAAIGALVWSLADRKRSSYRQLNYLLCLFLRYSLAIIAFGYGIQKIFALQMPFPLMSQLATPLGDLLPMRFSWLFVGYSTPYQVFSGILETTVALLLLYRRTATFGVMMAMAVFINVMMLNLCYDIPVKLYSMNIVLVCAYLLANEYRRIACFFILNKPADSCSIYHQPLPKKWMRITRIVIKLWVVFLFGMSVYDAQQYYRETQTVKPHKDLKPGYYDVVHYTRTSDSTAIVPADSLRWKDFIIDRNTNGSINTKDTIFRQRYGRAYFYFEADSLLPVIHFYKADQNFLSLQYKLTDSNTILLSGRLRSDSLLVELRKSKRHFQLAERPFHWLSEANR
ncbi:MAG: hypothetical protein H7Y86_20140 [Rhizobacter sp.]|nr:hypothetical protein [Ferruginibacter sp.]